MQAVLMAYSVHTLTFTKNQVREPVYSWDQTLSPPPPTQAPRHYTKATSASVRPNAIMRGWERNVFRLILHSKIYTNLHLDLLFHHENSFRI